MSKIKIADLQPTGSELFQSSESFLTELKPAEAHGIFGGSKKNTKKKKNKYGGGAPVIVIVPFPIYPCPPMPCGC
jgi:hypothetical protein